MPSDKATAAVSNPSVASVTTPKRRSTTANGWGSMRYDQLSSAMPSKPRPIKLPCPHHHSAPTQPAAASAASPMAPAQAANAIHAAAGRRRGCRQTAFTIAAAVKRSKAIRTGMSSRGNGGGKPKRLRGFDRNEQQVAGLAQGHHGIDQVARAGLGQNHHHRHQVQARAPVRTTTRRSVAARQSRAVAGCTSATLPSLNARLTRFCCTAANSRSLRLRCWVR